MSFQPGDNVRLKSSMTRMTVEWVDGDTVACVWIVHGQLGRGEFAAVTLVLAPKDPIDEVRRLWDEDATFTVGPARGGNDNAQGDES